MSRRNLYGGASGEDDEELSTSEEDDAYQEEFMEAIKQACLRTGIEDDKELHTSEIDDAVQEDIEALKKSDLRSTTEIDTEIHDSESDDDCLEDLEVLKQACLRTGTNPNGILHKIAAGGGNSVSDSESDDDLELFRSIKSRLGVSDDVCESRDLIGTPPPSISSDDEAEDDFQILSSIQSRLSAFNTAESESFRKDDCLRRTDEVNQSNMPSQEDSSSPLVNGADAVDKERSQHFEEFRNTSDLPSEENPAFPKAAHLLMDAIKRNRSYQRFVRDKLTKIDAKIKENKELRDRVKVLRDLEVSCKKRTGRALSLVKDPRAQLISTRKSQASKVSKGSDKVSSKHYGPPENSQVVNFRMALKQFPLSPDRKIWTKEKRENLTKGIRRQCQDMMLRGSADCGSEGSCRSRSNSDGIAGTIEDVEISPEMIRQFLPKVDWNQLALTYAPGRSGVECEARWLNHEDPLINHDKWTAREEKKLLNIIQEKGTANWLNIAASMGAKRTPFQCLAHYQRSLNASILNREWTEEEDDQLRSAVEAFGEYNWQSVASTLGGRTGTQCSNRWKKTLNPARQRVGKWAADEDKRLEVAVMLFGKNWKKISSFVPGRTQVQCRERWVNSLDPSITRGKWSEEEDSRLEAAVKEHGYRWSKIAASVTARTDNQCWKRWMKLHKDQVPLLQKARRLRKVACVSNFVDRESERPALSPDDLVELLWTGSKSSEPETVNAAPTKRKRRRSKTKTDAQEKENVAESNHPVKNGLKRRKKRVKRNCGEAEPGLDEAAEFEPVDNRLSERKTGGIKRTPKRHPWRRKYAKSGTEQER